MEENFNEWGIDAITGTEIMRLTGITTVDFTDPVRFQRFRDVIQHLKGVQDKQFYISRILTGKNVDKLDHLWGYTQLERQKVEKLEKAKEIEASFQEVTKNRESLLGDISRLDEEMKHYER